MLILLPAKSLFAVLSKAGDCCLQSLKGQIIFVIYIESFTMLLQINDVTVFPLRFWLQHLLF